MAATNPNILQGKLTKNKIGKYDKNNITNFLKVAANKTYKNLKEKLIFD